MVLEVLQIKSYSHAMPNPSAFTIETWKTPLKILCECVAYTWLFNFVNLVYFGRFFNRLGVRPRTLSGLMGILTSPFLHGNWIHLAGNTIPFLVLGGLIMLEGVHDFLIVTTIVGLADGFGTWLFGRPGIHLGASGIIFGYLGFLLLHSYFERDVLTVGVSFLVGWLYGKFLWDILPSDSHVSWERHLFGFIGGLLAARYLGVLRTMF